MINFDFNTMVDKFIDSSEFEEMIARREEIYSKFDEAYMTGWTKKIDDKQIEEILRVRDLVLSHSECLVVVGIGGSFI